MKRHDIWEDRAEKLMEKTFEKFGFGKKKDPVKEEKKEEIKENLQEAPRYGEDYAAMDGEDDGGNSLLDMDDYNMLEKAIEGPVRKLIADGYTKEDLVDAFKVMLGFENVNETPRYGEQYADMDGDEEEDTGDASQEVYTRIDKLKSHVDMVDMDEDAREYISDELLMILDKMDKNSMNEDETESPEVERAEDAARKAKIKALQVQLKALQKTQSME